MSAYVPLLQTGLWVGLALLGVLTFRRALTDRIKAGGGIKVGPVELQEIRTEVRDMRQQVHNLADRVSKLFLLSMAEPMHENLSKLASGHFGNYSMSVGLSRELRHLRDIGYIEVVGESISSIPPRGDELSHHVRASPAGKQFVELRNQELNPTD